MACKCLPRVFVAITLFFGLSQNIHSQEQLDSLREQLKSAQGMEKAGIQRIIAQRLMYIEPDSALLYIKEALEAFESGDDPKGYVFALLTRGSMLSESSELDKAEEILIKALTLAEEGNFKAGISWVSVALGSTHIRQGKYTEAAENHFRGATIAREIENYDLLLTHLMNLGILKTQLSLFDEASQYLLEAVALSADHGNKFREGQLYGNLGYMEYTRKNIALSKEYHKKSLEAFRDIDEKVNIVSALNNLGYAHAELNEINEAQASYTEAIELTREIGDKGREARILLNLAKLMRISGNLRKAITYTNQATQEGFSVGYVQIKKDLYLLRYEIFVELEEYKNALTSFEVYKGLEDSIRVSTDKAEITRLTSEYEFDRLEKENELRLKENEIKSLQLKQRNQMLLVTALLLLISIYIFIRIRNRLKIKLSLTQKDVQISQQAFEIEKERLMVYTQELLIKNQSLEEKQHQLEVESKEHGAKSLESYELLDKLSSAIVDDKDWKTFKLYFEAVYPGFFNRIIAEKKRSLTLGEQRLSALIKLSLSNKEVGAVLNISRNSVVRAKYRLRQKLGFAVTQELESYLLSF